MTDPERKAHFYVARKAREALDVPPETPDEAAYLTVEVRLAVIALTKELFFASGWDEDALRSELTRSRVKLVAGDENSGGSTRIPRA